jgi:hypothetical protein
MPRRPPVHQAEHAILGLAQYYGVPSLSVRNSLFHTVRANATAGLRLTDVLKDHSIA